MGLSHDSNSDLMVKKKEVVQEPPRYTCLLHNDHYTTREFVVYVLVTIFHLKEEDAQRKMMEVHKNGKGAVGNFSYDVARTKAYQTEKLAKDNDFPLKCTVESL